MRITNILLVTFGIALGFATSVVIVLGAGEAALLPAIQTIGSIAVAFSAAIAFGIYLSNVRRHRQEDQRKASETYLEESISLLDKAYDIFVQAGTDAPANDRLLWFSTARMIVRFQKMRGRIAEADHIAVIDENEEYTRGRFSRLLRRNRDNFSRQYFCPSGDLYSADNVSRKSLAVVFGFARWKDDIPDPLSEVDDIELFARGALPIDQDGAESYLEDFEEYWQKVQERKAQIDGANNT
jgi:hypothetical protein